MNFSLKLFVGHVVSYLLKDVTSNNPDLRDTINGSVSSSREGEELERIESLHKQQETQAVQLNQKKDRTIARAHNIWALGIVIVIGGQYFSWNVGLAAGFGSFFVATFLTGSMYLCLVLCLAEMTSSMPFAGGAYGFARVTLGTYVGFIVGCCESLEYIMYVAISVISLGRMITSLTGWEENLEPLYWILFYGASLAIHINDGKPFWNLCLYTAVLITFIPVFFCVATTPWMDFHEYAPYKHADQDRLTTDDWFVGGMSAFMTCLPLAAWFYVGVETLPLACAETFEPRKNVPLGMIGCVSTLLVVSLGVLFSTASLPPGIADLAVTLFPLNKGFAVLFDAHQNLMSVLTIPAVCATAFGFMFAYGRQMFAMARSGLFPEPLTRLSERSGTPYVALLVGSFISFCVCVFGWLYLNFQAIIFPICIIGAYSAYISQFLSFTILRMYYPSIDRQFTSPLGVGGAVYGGCIALISLVGALGFQQYQYESAVATVIYVSIASGYYYFIARHTQKFSPEEQSVLFVAYIVKVNVINAGKKSKKKSGPRPKPGSGQVVNMSETNSKGSDKVFSSHSEEMCSPRPPRAPRSSPLASKRQSQLSGTLDLPTNTHTQADTHTNAYAVPATDNPMLEEENFADLEEDAVDVNAELEEVNL